MMHPYKSLPPYCFWRQSVAAPDFGDVDPVVRPKFAISRSDRIATAGSCFAQHIARQLAASGFHYLVTEPAHPIVASCDVARYGYGIFTARYGNVYTSRQLLQLLHRAYGMVQPAEDVWEQPDGSLIDPFRPQIQPGGFLLMAEYAADRRRHFAAVRMAIETLDVLVFTLGLTETWISRVDGAAYPLCPGVAGGQFAPERHAFVNLPVGDVVADLEAALDFVRARNTKARVILTVSPVPLIATAEDRSVVVSTAYSKAVLRVAAEQVSASRENVAYFPSYEIITGLHAGNRYFDEDLRTVRPEGVAHVMRLFMQHYAEDGGSPPASSPLPERDVGAGLAKSMKEGAAVMCDEEALAN